MQEIYFQAEDVDFDLPQPGPHKQWISEILASFKRTDYLLNYIFCSDDYLLEINRTYLDRDYYTDIITFDNSDDHRAVEGDIFISIDRVRENAVEYAATFEEELRRVMAHGILHLLGFQDHSEEEKKVMRTKEEYCLSLYKK